MDWDGLWGERQAWLSVAPQAQGPWSLVEHPLWLERQASIERWALRDLQAWTLEALGDIRRPSIIQALGFHLLLRLVQVAWREADEQSLWPSLAEKAFPEHLSRQLFTGADTPTPKFYAALKQSFQGAGLRHAFHLQGAQPWELSLRLQMGPTQAGWGQQGFAWLLGATKPRALAMLLGEEAASAHLASPSMQKLWAALEADGIAPEAQAWLPVEAQRGVLLQSRKLGASRRSSGQHASSPDDARDADALEGSPWHWVLGLGHDHLLWRLSLVDGTALPSDAGILRVGGHLEVEWWTESGARVLASPTVSWPAPPANFGLTWGDVADAVALLPDHEAYAVWDLQAERFVAPEHESLPQDHDLVVLLGDGLVLEAASARPLKAQGFQAWHLQAPVGSWRILQEGAALVQVGASEPEAPAPPPQVWWEQGDERARPGGVVALSCESRTPLLRLAQGRHSVPLVATGGKRYAAQLPLPSRWLRPLGLRVQYLGRDCRKHWSPALPWKPQRAEGMALLQDQAWQAVPPGAWVPAQALRRGHWWAPHPTPDDRRGRCVLEGENPLCLPKGQGPSCAALGRGEALRWHDDSAEGQHHSPLARGEAPVLLAQAVVDSGWVAALGQGRRDLLLTHRVDPEGLVLQAWGPLGPYEVAHQPQEGRCQSLRLVHPLPAGESLLLTRGATRLGLHLDHLRPPAGLNDPSPADESEALALFRALRFWGFPLQAWPKLVAEWGEMWPGAWHQALWLDRSPKHHGSSPESQEAERRWALSLLEQAWLSLPANLWAPVVLAPKQAEAQPEANPVGALCLASPALAAQLGPWVRQMQPGLWKPFVGLLQQALLSEWPDEEGKVGSGAFHAWELWLPSGRLAHTDPLAPLPWERAISEGQSWGRDPSKAAVAWGGPTHQHPSLRAQLALGLAAAWSRG